MKLQQPRNYDFHVSQFNTPRSQSGNDCEMMTSPPSHHWEAIIALTTTAKLRQLRANSREMTTFAQSCNDQRNPTTVKWQVRNYRRKMCMRFCVASWLLSFQVPLGSLRVKDFSLNFPAATFSWPWNSAEGQGEFFWLILLWFLHQKVLVRFLLNTQNKPERWHKLTATLRQSQHVSMAELVTVLRPAILRWIFPRILLGIAGRFSWKKVPNPVKQRTWKIFSQKSPQEIPAQILPGCGSLLFSGCAGLLGFRPPPTFRTCWKISASPKPHPSKPHPRKCHKRKRKLRCNFRHAALQKLHFNIGFSAVRKSFGPEAALQQTKKCTATSKKLRCSKVAISSRFPADFWLPRL